MADIAARSQQLIYTGDQGYGIGYKPDDPATKSPRYSLIKTITDNGDGTATITLTITLKTNGSSTAVSGQVLTYELLISGSLVGSAVLKSGTQTLAVGKTYVRTLTATIPLDGTTTRVANLRLTNNTSNTWKFNSNTQGGDSLEGVPVGIQQSDFQSFSAFSIPDGAFSINAKVVRKSAGVTHDVKLKHADGTVIASWTGLGEFTSLSLTQAQARAALNKMPSSVSGEYTLEVTSKHPNAGTLGTKARTATGTVAASVQPSLTSITASEQNATVATEIGGWVQSHSIAKLTLNGGEAGYGSTINRYEIDFDGSTWTSPTATTATSGPIRSSGTVRATGRVIDNRGRVATKTLDLMVLAWQPPRITTYDAYRCNADGTRNDAGTYVRVDRSGSISSLKVGGVEKNRLQIRTWFKLVSDTTWTAATNDTWGVTSYTGHTLVGGGNILTNRSYNIRLHVNDVLGTPNASVYFVIGTSRKFIDLYKDIGIGIGKSYENGVLDIEGNVYQSGKYYLNGEDTRWGDTVAGAPKTGAPTAWADYCDYGNLIPYFFKTGAFGPVDSWLGFVKLTSRNANKGWAGLWMALSSTALYYGSTPSTTTPPTISRILVASMYGHGGSINADMVDGIHAETIVQVKTIGGYPGLARNGGADNGYFRTTQHGLLPYEQNTANGTSGLGTSYWPFNNGYMQRVSIAELYYRDFTGQSAGDKVLEFTTRDNNVFHILLGHLGRVWAVEILTMDGGRLVPQADNRTHLGETARRWKAVHAVIGTIQTSGRAHKEHIHRPDRTMLQALLDRAADSLVAFDYRDADPYLSSQLGLIADDIADTDGYELIGTRELVTDKDTGETRTEYGLKPLAVASLALHGYRVQRDRADALERRVDELEARLARLEAMMT